MSHTWTQDADGYLLAVSYGQAGAPLEQPAVQPAAPAIATQPVPEPVAPPAPARPAYQPVQRIPVQRPDAAAPAMPPPAQPMSAALNGMPQLAQPPLESQWLPPQVMSEPAPARMDPVPPIARYTPPPEMYLAPPELYESVAPTQAVAETPVEAPAAAPSPSPAAAPTPPTALSDSYSRQAKLTVQVVDLHTAGEPLRLIRSGFPDVPMLPVLERRHWVKDNADHVRRALMYEPRGHKDMYGAILLPPFNDYADMTVLFMHNEGYSTMCGHGVIAITTGLIEEGLFPATEPVTTIRYEVPAGIVAANAATVQLDDGTWAVRGVRFTNVPSYLAAQSLSVKPDGIELRGSAAQYGALAVDIAFGGAYYGIVNAAELGLRVVPEQAEELRRAGAAITDVLRRDHTPAHPSDADLSFVYGTIIVDLDPRSSPDGKARDAHIRNATIFADAEVDRSPCGSGTSAILAQLHARGRIKVGQEIVNAGITGEHFLGRVEAETALGPYAAVSTSIAGTAYVTGYSTFVVDSRDPLGDGFLLG
jgi:trans-L-3-hydroxyproline dehydratase